MKKKQRPKKQRKLSLRQELQVLREDHRELVKAFAVFVQNNGLMIQQLKWLTHTLEEHLKGP